MKLICFPYCNRNFYLKPETAILRNGRTFYTPDQTSRIEGAMALVVKIDRLCRHISPQFACRCYHETALGFCLYAADLLEESRTAGNSWAPACTLDYSAPLSELFIPVTPSITPVTPSITPVTPSITPVTPSITPVTPSNHPSHDLFAWDQWRGRLTESIDNHIAHLSRYIFLKMGDLIWFELHPPLPLSAPCEVHASRNGQDELQFYVK